MVGKTTRKVGKAQQTSFEAMGVPKRHHVCRNINVLIVEN
jgi:hypothetical protein